MPEASFNGYNASMFTLFFPEPPSPQDKLNWDRSLCPQAMLFWDNAENVIPSLCAKGHKRGDTVEGTRFILRIPNGKVMLQRNQLELELARKQQVAHDSGGSIVAVLLGNEWDLGWDLRWHDPAGKTPDWGNTQQPAPLGLVSATSAGVLVQGAGAYLGSASTKVALVSGAYSMRGYTEDDAPDPGLFSWREVTGPGFYGYASNVSGNGVHYYDSGWWEHDPPPLPPGAQNALTWAEWSEALAGARCATQANVHRFMQAVRFWSGFHHHLLYWDEVQTKRAALTPAQHMEACVGKSKLLIHHRNPLGYQLGERVAMFCPFTSNGPGNDYPQEYVMTDPACYEVVRQHMMEEGYVDA